MSQDEPEQIVGMSGDERGLVDIIHRDQSRLIGRTLDWCAVNSGSRNLAGLLAVADQLEAELGRLAPVRRIELEPLDEVGPTGEPARTRTGPCLRADLRPDAPVQVVLTGHYDTVFPPSSGFQAVTQRADGALNGPGVADMKGGISVMLGALEAFEQHPLAERVGWRVLLSPDEEIGSLASAPELARVAEGAHLGLTYEPALAGGALASSRKGSGNFSVIVKGRAAHAGRDFAAGRNAVTAAARIAGTLDALNGRREGVTVNVARIEGGAPSNQVPDRAVLRFNVRLPQAEDRAWIEAALPGALDAGRGEGLEVSLHGGFTRPPKPISAAQQQLFDGVRETAGLLDIDLNWTPSGGVCEGNNLYAAGLPNLDTLGVRGGDIHTEAEHAWPDSFAERAALSALILARIASGAIDARAIRAAMG